ncbi:MAG: hypothetical protein ABI624_23990 [Casimicrobiaceae bacterium]
MLNDEPIRDERSSFGTGVRTAALIVILGAIAAVADQAFFVNPHQAVSTVSATAPATAAPAQSGAFAVPDNLRTNSGEVPAHVSAF